MKPETATVVEWHHMGDAVMALPFIQGALHSGIRISICASPAAAAVFRLIFPGLPITVFDSKIHRWWAGASWETWRRTHGSDLAVCAWADPRTHYWMKAAGFSRRVGLPPHPTNWYAREAALKRPMRTAAMWGWRLAKMVSGPLLTEQFLRPRLDLHHQENWTMLAVMLGFAPATPQFPQSLGNSNTSQSYWVIHPGARDPWKWWPEERWEQLLAELPHRWGIQTVLVQGPGIPSIKNLPKGQEVRQTPEVADLLNLLHPCQGLVALDSFPAHLAAAMGKKTVVLFGDMPDCWFRPIGNQVASIRTPQLYADLRLYHKLRRSLVHAVEVETVGRAVFHLAQTDLH